MPPNRRKNQVGGRNRSRALYHRRELRRQSTEAEQLVWSVVRGRKFRGYKFYCQYSIGPYIVDFACPEKWIVVEIDGEYHDYVGESDLSREATIARLGWRVLRYSNSEVMADVDAVKQGIEREIAELKGM